MVFSIVNSTYFYELFVPLQCLNAHHRNPSVPLGRTPPHLALERRGRLRTWTGDGFKSTLGDQHRTYLTPGEVGNNPSLPLTNDIYSQVWNL